MRAKGMLLKACRRCGGDLVFERDEAWVGTQATGVMYVCLQCGRRYALGLAPSPENEERPREAA